MGKVQFESREQALNFLSEMNNANILNSLCPDYDIIQYLKNNNYINNNYIKQSDLEKAQKNYDNDPLLTVHIIK